VNLNIDEIKQEEIIDIPLDLSELGLENLDGAQIDPEGYTPEYKYKIDGDKIVLTSMNKFKEKMNIKDKEPENEFEKKLFEYIKEHKN